MDFYLAEIEKINGAKDYDRSQREFKCPGIDLSGENKHHSLNITKLFLEHNNLRDITFIENYKNLCLSLKGRSGAKLKILISTDQGNFEREISFNQDTNSLILFSTSNMLYIDLSSFVKRFTKTLCIKYTQFITILSQFCLLSTKL